MTNLNVSVGLQEEYNKIMSASFSEDVFGTIEDGEIDTQLQELKKIYRQLSKAFHPDRYTGENDKKVAGEGFSKLNEFYGKAKEKIQNGVYGQRLNEESGGRENNFVIKTRKGEYCIKSAIAEGDLSTVYGGECIESDNFAGKVAVKVIENSADNDLAKNEVRILKMFQASPANQSKHLPVLLDQFRTMDGQLGTILNYLDGYDFYSVREKYKNGVPQKHMVWMLNRLLSVVGYAHKRGIIHGNIEPAHLMIRPKDHNLWLIDWSYASVNPTRSGDGFKAINKEYSAPEVKERKTPLSSSDLYSVGKCMIYILGGDVKTNSMPLGVDEKLQRFIQFFVRESPLQRARDAWEMHRMLGELVGELWGPKRFLEFKM